MRQPSFRAQHDDDLIRRLIALPLVRSFDLSPSGRHLALAIETGGKVHPYVLDLQRGRLAMLAPDEVATTSDPAPDLRWSPDGRFIAYLEGGKQPRLRVRDAQTGDPVPITTFGQPHGRFCWSPDGRQICLVVNIEGKDRLALAAPGTRSLTVLTDGPQDDHSPTWSVDGRWIAFVRSGRPTLKSRHLMILDVETRATIPITIGPGERFATEPAWHPRNWELAFIADDDDRPQAWLARFSMAGYTGDAAAVSYEVKPLTRDATDKLLPVWSNDGESLLVVASRNGRSIVLGPVTGTGHEVTALTPAEGSAAQPRMTNDGRLYYLYSTFDSPPSVWVSGVAVPGATASPEVVVPIEGFLPKLMIEPPRRVQYESEDGLSIEAWLMLPSQQQRHAQEDGSAAPAPGIVYLHGGPTAQYMDGWQPLLAYLVHRGYAVFAPDYRGSTGYGRRFEQANDGDWGGGDLRDVIAAGRYLRSLREVDARRVGVFGGSYGGYLTLLALTKYPDAYRCGIALYGVSNRVSYWDQTDKVGHRGLASEMGHVGVHRELFQDRSPVSFAHQLRAPLLILHGTDDARVPYAQSEEFVERVRTVRPDADVYFKGYEGEGHGFRRPDHVADVWRQIEGFLQKYL